MLCSTSIVAVHSVVQEQYNSYCFPTQNASVYPSICQLQRIPTVFFRLYWLSMAFGNTVNFRLLVREKAKIHRSHKKVFNGLVVDIYTMWFNSIVPPLHCFCVCTDVSMTSNLKFTVSTLLLLPNKERSWVCGLQALLQRFCKTLYTLANDTTHFQKPWTSNQRNKCCNSYVNYVVVEQCSLKGWHSGTLALGENRGKSHVCTY